MRMINHPLLSTSSTNDVNDDYYTFGRLILCYYSMFIFLILSMVVFTYLFTINAIKNSRSNDAPKVI